MQTNRRQRPQQKTTHLEAAKAKPRSDSRHRRSAWTPMILSMSRRIAFGCGRRGKVFHPWSLKPPWISMECLRTESPTDIFLGCWWVFLPVYQKNTQIVISPWVYFHVFMFVHIQYESHDRNNQYRMSLWSELIPIPGWWLVLWGRTG